MPAAMPEWESGSWGLYLIITVVRNIVEPKLVGKQMGLSPVVMLPCMILGLHFFGILGLFGVPLLASFLKNSTATAIFLKNFPGIVKRKIELVPQNMYNRARIYLTGEMTMAEKII